MLGGMLLRRGLIVDLLGGARLDVGHDDRMRCGTTILWSLVAAGQVTMGHEARAKIKRKKTTSRKVVRPRRRFSGERSKNHQVH